MMDTTWATTSATIAPWADYSYEALKAAMLKAEEMLKKCPPTINKVICQRYLCQPQFVKWNRRHRRSRINRKWQKRYGALLRCDGVAYQVMDTLLVCPCAAKHLPPGTLADGKMVSSDVPFFGLSPIAGVFSRLAELEAMNAARQRQFQFSALPYEDYSSLFEPQVQHAAD